jgi:hypothetical protein
MSKKLDPLLTLHAQQSRDAARARGTATLTGMGFLAVVALILCALRLFGVVAWPWWLCLSPVALIAFDVVATTLWHRINGRR